MNPLVTHYGVSQAGIGTYSAPGIVSGVELWAAKLLDEAFAWYLDAHASRTA